MPSDTESGAVVAAMIATGEEPGEFARLMGALVEQQRRDYAHTTSSLIDSLAWQVADLQARLDLVCRGVEDALDAPYMPSPSTLLYALHPSAEAVAERREWHLTHGGIHSSVQDE